MTRGRTKASGKEKGVQAKRSHHAWWGAISGGIIAVALIAGIWNAIVLVYGSSEPAAELSPVSNAVHDYLISRSMLNEHDTSTFGPADDRMFDELTKLAERLPDNAIRVYSLGNWTRDARLSCCADPTQINDGFVLFERGVSAEGQKQWTARVYIQDPQVNLLIIRE